MADKRTVFVGIRLSLLNGYTDQSANGYFFFAGPAKSQRVGRSLPSRHDDVDALIVYLSLEEFNAGRPAHRRRTWSHQTFTICVRKETWE